MAGFCLLLPFWAIAECELLGQNGHSTSWLPRSAKQRVLDLEAGDFVAEVEVGTSSSGHGSSTAGSHCPDALNHGPGATGCSAVTAPASRSNHCVVHAA